MNETQKHSCSFNGIKTAHDSRLNVNLQTDLCFFFIITSRMVLHASIGLVLKCSLTKFVLDQQFDQIETTKAS